MLSLYVISVYLLNEYTRFDNLHLLYAGAEIFK